MTEAARNTTADEDPAFTLGDRIRKRRVELDLDQQHVADRLSVSRPLISKWERGKSIPDVAQAVALAAVLECSFGWLCGVPAQSRYFGAEAA